MEKRISKQAKAIADKHIAAKLSGQFDNPQVSTKEDIISSLMAGKTFSAVLETIETRFCSIGTLLLASGIVLDVHLSDNYKANIYKGFKILIDRQ